MADVIRLASRSLAGKFAALSIIFLIVPITLYGRFAAADAERQSFLLANLQLQGRLAAKALEPQLGGASGKAPLEAAKAVDGLAGDQVRIKLLLRPSGREGSFFLVAASPAADGDSMASEYQQLVRTGVLSRLDDSCAGDQSLALRYAAASGKEELLTSLSPLHTSAGCWVVITSYAPGEQADSLARPFAEAPEVRMATVFYALMAVLLGIAITGALLDISAFAKLAKRIRHAGAAGAERFATVAAIPELLPVAREFDCMVTTLDASARNLREAAEDNAHAFKPQIAAISQSLEALRRAVGDEPRSVVAVRVIERALDRLGGLVNTVRCLDVAAADLMKAKLDPVDLGALATQMADAYGRTYVEQGIRVEAEIHGPAIVVATEECLETAIENLLDNAVEFSPKDAAVRVIVARIGDRVELVVSDSGPGVPEDQLEHIFRRNFSRRPDADSAVPHFGIGLAVVRRSVELLGGTVEAENREEGGLRVRISLPAA